jgi:hypothetical protein
MSSFLIDGGKVPGIQKRQKMFGILIFIGGINR